MLPSLAVAVLLLFMVYGRQATAAEQSGIPRKVPTTITSDRMDYDANAQTLVFLGNVHVKRPDFELWSEKMTVYLDKSGKSNESAAQSSTAGMEAGNIERIVAEKNVRLKSENNTGTSEKATYYAKEDKFIMEGNPVLKDNKQNTVTGTRIIHFLSSNRSQVIGGGTATFYSEDRTEGGGPPAPTPVLPGTGAKNGKRKQ
jgi:lipopolysaccharide export system protein LptA